MSVPSNSGSAAIVDLLRLRKSTRALSPAPVERSAVWRLLEAARWAPSARNEQPWRFVIVRRDQSEQFGKLIGSMHLYNQEWAKNASLLIAVIVKKNWGDDGGVNPYAFYDCGQAVAHLTVQAQSEGISIRQVGSFDTVKAAEILETPSDLNPFLLLALGTPGDPNDLPEQLRNMELAPRSRKALFEIAYQEKWNKPLA
jgi:nitroreductase